MGRIDMVGRRCGHLIVIAKNDVYKGYDTRWICRCDCGNQTIVRGSYLRNGHTKSCGNCQRFSLDNGIAKCTVKSGRSFWIDEDDLSTVQGIRWSVGTDGYVIGYGPDGRKVKLHRLVMNAKQGEVVDHINGNPADCRRKNLRITTQHRNTYNSRLPKSSTTGYKGVCFDKRNKRYMAHIHPNGKTVFLGYFVKPEEAAIAYDRAASFYFGEYARLNFSKEAVNETEVLELGEK